MAKKRIMLCWGTRPEVLKMTSLALGLRRSKKFHPVIVFTGQHRAMARQVMRLFGLRAHYNLKVMTRDQTLGSLSERILMRMDRLLAKVRPECVLVQGDTTTAFLCALAAFYRRIPVGHVEAGLRTDDKYQPFPEEINRRLISQIADYHFAPTSDAGKRLVREGVSPKKILKTGNTGLDALGLMKRKLSHDPNSFLKSKPGKKIVFVTAHRRESFGAPLMQICKALKKIASQMPETDIYYPVHLNPRVWKPVTRKLKGFRNIHLMKPLAYDKAVRLMQKADLILTDSGGIQEEAPSFYKPILVMRNVTERPEGVRAGFSRVVGSNAERIYREAYRSLNNPKWANRIRGKQNPYGDGKAAPRIIRFLEKHL